MFKSIYAEQISQYYGLRESVLSDSARKHELCYLLRFDKYLKEHISSIGQLNESVINNWIGSLSGKSKSIRGEVFVIRRFLNYLKSCGECVYLPIIPKDHDDYVPYIFSDNELKHIFLDSDNIVQKSIKTDPYLVIEFPVIIRLLYSCGLRLGEALKIDISDVDLKNGIIKLRNTKRDKHRLVPMNPAMTDILTKYCMVMGLYGVDIGWLFPSSKNEGHISSASVKHRFENILVENDIFLPNRKKHERGPCLHCLRHVFAFKSFAKGEREGKYLDDMIPYLSIFLGHDSLDETSKYLKFSNELFPESIDIFGKFMEDLLPEVAYET